jgi:hypothetical protein
LCHMCIMVTKEALVSIFRVEAKVKAAWVSEVLTRNYETARPTLHWK